MNHPIRTPLAGLPGESLIQKGWKDFQQGNDTIEACLIQIAAPKLALSGWELPLDIPRLAEPELHLYALLQASEPDAYGRYNGLLRILSSFGRSLESRHRRQSIHP